MPDDFYNSICSVEDVQSILQFIHALAKYEKLAHEVVATPDLLKESLFTHPPKAETLLAFEEDKPVGFALFFSNYSTFLGRAGIHLEDLFVLEEYRGRGYGKALLDKMQVIAIEFYEAMGAKAITGWTTYRMTWQAISNKS